MPALPNLFTKSQKKKPASSVPSPRDPHDSQSTPPSSPEKRSASRSSKDSKRDRTPTSSKPPKHSFSRSSSRRYDPDTHPLNLPPDERSKRLSALSAMSEPNTPMDVDREATASPAPSSPMNGTTASNSQANGAQNSAKDDSKPVPPPHRTPTSPPPTGNGPTSPPQRTGNPLPQPPRNEVQAEEFKKAGNKFYTSKDYDRAIQEYTKAIEADPKASTYPFNRAAAYMGANRYLEALEDAKLAEQLEPTSPKILHRLARIYTFLGRPNEALDVYDRINPPATAKDKGPALAMAHHLKQAEEQLRTGTSGSLALHALEQAEKGLGFGVSKPRKWQLLRGEAYLKMGNPNALGDAQNVAMSLLRSNPADPDALVLRGRVLYAQGENEKAIQHFRQALSYDPDFKDAVKYLRMVQKLDRMKEEGNNLFKAGKYEEAVNKYSEALAVDPSNKGTNSKILQNRALCQIKLKNYDSAIADCTRAVELDPSYTKAKKTKAKALGEAGKWEEAVREYKAVQEANPAEPGIAKDIRNAELELKKSQRKDYYKILGVDKEAGDAEIKKAYRKLAIVHHPDKNPGDTAAEERFKDIQEAYETLSDPQKRARYDSGEDLIDPADMFGGGGGFPGGMHAGGGVQINPEMLFNMFGGGGGGGGGFAFGGGGSPFGGAQFQTGGGRGGRGGAQYSQGFPF